MNESIEATRLECLRLALATCGQSTKEHVLETAKAYEAWVTKQTAAA